MLPPLAYPFDEPVMMETMNEICLYFDGIA